MRSSKETLAPKDLKSFKEAKDINKDYQMKENIGHGKENNGWISSLFLGSFGEVVKAIHLPTGMERAIKIIDKRKIEKHQILMQLQKQEFFVLMETVNFFKSYS